MRKILAAVILLCLLLNAAAPITAQAQSGIQVVHETTFFSFAKEMCFEIITNNVLKEANLFYRIEGEVAQHRHRAKIADGVAYVRILLYPGGIPPAAKVSYFWRLEDIHGNLLRTEDKSLLYLDDRFGWRNKKSEEVEVFWYGRDPQSGDIIFAQIGRSFARIKKRLGLTLKTPIKVVVYQNWNDMRPSVPGRWEGTPVVTLGLAFDRRTLIFSHHHGWEDTLTHELTHLLTYQLLGDPYDYLPFWLSEGLATYTESSSRGLITNPLRLSYLSAKPTRPELVGPAYAQAQSLVTFLVEEKGGKEKIAQLLTVMGGGELVDDALLAVYGFNRRGLEKEWREWIGHPLPKPTEGVTKPKEEAVAAGVLIEIIVSGTLLLAILILTLRAKCRQNRRNKTKNPH